MKTSILNFIRENGIISFNDIIYALNLQTEYNEAAKQIAYLQTNSISPNGGLSTVCTGKGLRSKIKVNKAIAVNLPKASAVFIV